LSAYVDWYANLRVQEWRTPKALFECLHREYAFNLDGAASEANKLLPEASTPEAPIPWDGRRVFCNPPWSAIAPFVEIAPEAELAVLLVPARTNVRWFHRALELGASVRFFVGRPVFEAPSPEKQKGHNSPVDCLLLVFDGGIK
jgi:hypothetical protein